MYEHKTFTDNELRELVVKVFDGKIFTSFQCDPNNITTVFMPILFINMPPSPPNEPELKPGDNIKEKRKNKLNLLDEKEQWEKDMEHYNNVTYPEWEKNVKPKIDAFLNDVGMLYESMDKAMPTGVNGYPMFVSCGFMSKADTKRFIEFYQKYEQKRKEIDSDF